MVAKETRKRKRSEAEARQAEYSRLSVESKLARVATRPGKSAKETARLEAQR